MEEGGSSNQKRGATGGNRGEKTRNKQIVVVMTRTNSRCSREKREEKKQISRGVASLSEIMCLFPFDFCYAVRGPLVVEETRVDASGGPPRRQPGPMHPSRCVERDFWEGYGCSFGGFSRLDCNHEQLVDFVSHRFTEWCTSCPWASWAVAEG